MGIFDTPDDYDRIDTNDDGTSFYGYDNEDGTTDWYSSTGQLDSITDTPDDDYDF